MAYCSHARDEIIKSLFLLDCYTRNDDFAVLHTFIVKIPKESAKM